MAIDKKIAFLGGGNMAEALIKGLLAAGAAKADQIFVTDISSDRLEHLKKTYGIIIQKNNRRNSGAVRHHPSVREAAGH